MLLLHCVCGNNQSIKANLLAMLERKVEELQDRKRDQDCKQDVVLNLQNVSFSLRVEKMSIQM